MTAIIFIIVLAVLILVHEFGHFITAKKIGARVDEFGLGFPPRAWGKKIGETLYSLNWIPFGGFVKIFGETPDEMSVKGPDSLRCFYNKPKWAQAIVLAGGVIFNFIFAWILISICFFFGTDVGKQDYLKYKDRFTEERVFIVGVPIGTPAYNAGLRLGDSIEDISIVGNTNPKGIKMSMNAPYITSIIMASEGKDLQVGYKRKGELQIATITPKKGLITDDKERLAIGVAMSDAAKLSLPIHLSIYEGARYTVIMIKETAVGLYSFFSKAFIGQANFNTVSGPLGIAGMVGDAARTGILNLFLFTAIISINLGVINLAPFPALDGGRLLFLLAEAISRKRIPMKIVNAVNGIGFIILLALMVLVTYKDLIKIF